MTVDDTKDALAAHYQNIIELVGEDPEREGLRDTPQRAAKAMQYLCSGYSMSLETVVNNAIFESDTDEMVVVRNIELYSLCEHHLLPFIGQCHIAYIPNGKVLGLSKFARIVDMYGVHSIFQCLSKFAMQWIRVVLLEWNSIGFDKSKELIECATNIDSFLYC